MAEAVARERVFIAVSAFSLARVSSRQIQIAPEPHCQCLCPDQPQA